jgi:hypothetical protein
LIEPLIDTHTICCIAGEQNITYITIIKNESWSHISINYTAKLMKPFKHAQRLESL